MTDFQSLQTLLEEQFGQFIRDIRYQGAFQRAIQTLKSLDNPQPSSIDTFYLFLHMLILDLFKEINSLKQQIEVLKSQKT